MLGQYDADTASGRAALQAGLLQQGFTQANQLAQQAFANQGTLAQNQFGLSNFGRTGMGQDISALGSLGAINQGQEQANLTANQKEQVLTEPLIMEESEILKVQAASGAVDVVASILEINREDR